MSLRRVAAHAMILAAALLVACRPDMAAWTRHLADPAVAKLDGTWSIELRADSGEYGRETMRPRTTGTIALVLNRGRVTTSWFGPPPVAFGTYDVPFDSLNIVTGDAMGTPDVWVNVRGDSIALQFSPEAKWPISLAGVWHGDSVVGRWHADQRAGPSGVGEFVLRRR